MQPLFNKCTPFTEPKQYFLTLEGATADGVHKLTKNRALLKGISWESMTIGTVRVFQHDENENEFYIAVYPYSRIKNARGNRFQWVGAEQLFDNLPESLVTNKVRDYIPPLIYELNMRNEQGIVPPHLAINQKYEKVELEGQLYGPTTRDEIINHMRLRFAYL